MHAGRVGIRDAGPEDVEAILVVLREAFTPYRPAYTPEAYRATVLDPARLAQRMEEMEVLVAEDRGEVFGTVAWEAASIRQGHLRGMAVVPRVQGESVAALLLTEAERRARARGCETMTLATTRVLKRAIAFCQRHGYAFIGEASEFFGMELLEMRRRL